MHPLQKMAVSINPIKRERSCPKGSSFFIVMSQCTPKIVCLLSGFCPGGCESATIAADSIGRVIQEGCKAGSGHGRVPAAVMALIRMEAFHLAVAGTWVDLKAEMETVEHPGGGTPMVITVAQEGRVLLLKTRAGVDLMNLTSWHDSGAGDLLPAHTEQVRTFLRIFFHSDNLLYGMTSDKRTQPSG